MLLILAPCAQAAWTGIAAFASQQESDWSIGGQTLVADSFQYGLRIEEKTRPGLRIGLGIGQFHLRLEDRLNLTAIQEFDGEFAMFYMRWPFTLNDRLTLHSRFDYLYHQGRDSDSDTDDDIDWIEAAVDIGVRYRVGIVSLQPYMRYRSVDGDLDLNNSTRLFSDSSAGSFGIKLDIHVEPSAYVRLQASFDAVDALGISFVREY